MSKYCPHELGLQLDIGQLTCVTFSLIVMEMD